MKKTAPRDIPSVHKVVEAVGDTGLPRPIVVSLARREVSRMRDESPSHCSENVFDVVVARVREAATILSQCRLQPVINATGIIVHTNLGRSPLSAGAIELMARVAAGYCNLEYDVSTGRRGQRAAYLETALEVLLGYPATVVNNCAAGLVLILNHLCSAERKQVVISRGELVQIGGGFRIPEILEASGAELREVGTTNKTSACDYAKAIGKKTAMVLRVHRSNFFMGGFVESPRREDIAAAAYARRVPFVEDLGSGAVLGCEYFPRAEHEPTPTEVLKAGVDLVCFSGDKLLGGPQAGIVAGKARLIKSLKNQPLFRALRCDKLTTAALQATVETYLCGTDISGDISILNMMRIPLNDLHARATAIVAAIIDLPLTATVGEAKGQVGGGTLPKSLLPSVTVELRPLTMKVNDLSQRLRSSTPPLLGYVAGGLLKLDMRTIFPSQDTEIIAVVRMAFS